MCDEFENVCVFISILETLSMNSYAYKHKLGANFPVTISVVHNSHTVITLQTGFDINTHGL